MSYCCHPVGCNGRETLRELCILLILYAFTGALVDLTDVETHNRIDTMQLSPRMVRMLYAYKYLLVTCEADVTAQEARELCHHSRHRQ